MKLRILSVVIVVLLCGCSDRRNLSPMPTISKDAKTELAKPINCQTAKQDIKTLESERASVAKRMLSGVRSVMPIAAVVGILMGDYSDRFEVTTGQYNADIEKKISEIETACGISKPASK